MLPHPCCSLPQRQPLLPALKTLHNSACFGFPSCPEAPHPPACLFPGSLHPSARPLSAPHPAPARSAIPHIIRYRAPRRAGQPRGMETGAPGTHHAPVVDHQQFSFALHPWPGPARRATGAARGPAASPAGGAALPARPGPALPALTHYRFRLPQEVSPWEPRPQRGERGRPAPPGTAPVGTGSSSGPGGAAAPPHLRPFPRPCLHLHPHPLSRSHLHPCFPSPSHSFPICIHIRDPTPICLPVSIHIPVPVSIHIYICAHISICIPVPKPIPVSILSTAVLPWGHHPVVPPPHSLGSLRGLLLTPGKGGAGAGDISRPSTRCHQPTATCPGHRGSGAAPRASVWGGCLCCVCQQSLAQRSSGRAAWSHQTDA